MLGANHIPRRQAGVTLVELMFVIAIGAILLVVVVPHMGDLIDRNRVTAQTNALVGALNLSRSEAVTRGLPVSVCALSAVGSSQCSTASAPVIWEHGWAVFVDDGANPGTIDAGEQVLRLYPELTGNTSLRATVPTLTYMASGFLLAGATSFNLRIPNCRNEGHRDIAVSTTGRPSTSHVSC